MLRKVGAEEPKKYNYHFKHMTSVGEPIEPVNIRLRAVKATPKPEKDKK